MYAVVGEHYYEVFGTKTEARLRRRKLEALSNYMTTYKIVEV